eukprot:TRINITY_DN9136_c1_g1_i1.p1 TRINITY_DN9136_c1_g1~~TRINITY_DN9136_c1_g1_i1.p1  ORF type:complete len:417 (-),score=69.20 TRINITY_DN9136_c1_g1_i1:94-1344(-)
MLASIILVFCTLASFQSCATALDTHAANSAGVAAPSNYTTMTSTFTTTSSTEYSTTVVTIPAASGTLTATPSSRRTNLSTTHSLSATSTMSLSTTNSIKAEAVLATRSLVFAGDYATVVGSEKTRFLEECSASLAGATCIDVRAGSIIVTVQGLPSELVIVTSQLQASGLDLPSFASLSLDMTETVTVSITTSTTTTGITTSNSTFSQGDAPADDQFVMPVVIIAGSVGGLCLSLACCYGVLMFRRWRRKLSKETEPSLDNSQDLDCVVLKVEEGPQESPQESKEAAGEEMSRTDLDIIHLNVEESLHELPEKSKEVTSREAPSQDLASMDRSVEGTPQGSPLELKEMHSGEALSRDMPRSPAASRDMPGSPAASNVHATVVGTVVAWDEWKLSVSDDAPEPLPARCEINRGRTSL